MLINFTVGPVQSDESVLALGAQSTPYFRTSEFSQVMFENERIMKLLVHASPDARTVFITGSGTASMEAAVMNTLTPKDKALVVVGGTFGRRFSQLCDVHGIPHTDINLQRGVPLTEKDLVPHEGQGYTAFLINLCETSTGVLYDADIIGDFCRRNGLFLIVDAISSFLADKLDMEGMGAQIIITGSQKALACPPGISIIVLSSSAVERVYANSSRSMYLDLKLALENGSRGQTPFTPAVTTLLQIHERLIKLEASGVEAETARIAVLADDFRKKIRHLPLTPSLLSPSNAVTYLAVADGVSAKRVIDVLKDRYQIWVCPNAGEDANRSFRVGHIGNLSVEDNDSLICALNEMSDVGLLG